MTIKFISKLNIDWGEISPIELKYKPINRILNSDLDSRFLIVINEMLDNSDDLCFNGDVKTFIDVKVRHLKKGETGCALPDWHYDWVKDFDNPKPHETHFIYSNVNGTEFIDDVGVMIKSGDGEIWKYNRDLHRCPVMIEDCLRVVIRVSFVY